MFLVKSLKPVKHKILWVQSVSYVCDLGFVSFCCGQMVGVYCACFGRYEGRRSADIRLLMGRIRGGGIRLSLCSLDGTLSTGSGCEWFS